MQIINTMSKEADYSFICVFVLFMDFYEFLKCFLCVNFFREKRIKGILITSFTILNSSIVNEIIKAPFILIANSKIIGTCSIDIFKIQHF